jgi:minor tail protein
MAEREASIKLTLDDGQFVASMGKSGDAAVKAAQRSERAMQVLGAGVQKATANVKQLGSTARSSLGMVSGLLGGLTFGSALKGAVELDSKFKQLAFRVSTATREQVKHTDLLRLAEQAAVKTGRRTAEMADAYDQLFSATGDRDFTDNMLETIGEAATATGQEIATLTSLADQMHTKFGVAAADMGDVFGQVFEAAQMGGPSFQEFADVASNMGAELLNAGLDGRRGLDFMLGSLVATDDAMGNLQKQVKGIKQILLSLGDTAQITAIAKALHIDPKKLLNEKDLMGRMRRILGMGKKGLDAIKGSMKEAEEQKALKILFTDPFEAALKDANASGLKGKEAIDKALGVLDAQINDLGKSLTHGTHLQDEANRRRNDPERRLTAALDVLQRSFGDPRIIEAIDGLSKYLPQIAEVFGKFAKFVVKNPVLASTLAVGGKAGSGFLEGIITTAVTEALTGGGSGAGGGGKVAGRGGGGARTGGIERHHQFLGEGLTEAQMLANGIEDGIEDGGKKGASKMATAIRLAGIASAAALALELGKEFIGNLFKDKSDAMNHGAVVGAQTASKGGGLERQKGHAVALRAEIAKLREERGGFFEGLFSMLSNLPNAGGSGLMSPDGSIMPTMPVGFTPQSGPNRDAIAGKQIAELEQQLKEKEAWISELESNPSAAAGVDGKAVGKAVADTLKQGQPLVVHVANMPAAGGAPAAKPGPGGSKGVKRPAAQASGSGL